MRLAYVRAVALNIKGPSLCIQYAPVPKNIEQDLIKKYKIKQEED